MSIPTLEIAEAGGKVHDQAILVAEAVEITGAHIEKARESKRQKLGYTHTNTYIFQKKTKMRSLHA